MFDEPMILNESVETWPHCDCIIMSSSLSFKVCFLLNSGLISYHSKGFPLEKAIAYAKLRLPYVINDLERQYDLMDRFALCTLFSGKLTCFQNLISLSFQFYSYN